MAYRDQVLAVAAQAEMLRDQLVLASLRADRAEARAGELEAQLENVLYGAWREQYLRADPHVGIAQVLLPIAGALGGVSALVVWSVLFRPAFMGHLELSPRGIENFLDQLQRGDALGGFIAMLAVLALACAPMIAAVGVARRRKWGWRMAVITWTLWCVPFPPLGIYGLYAFCRDDVRRAFLGPTWAELAAQEDEVVLNPA